MRLKIITHENIVFDEEVEEIYSKGENGEFGVLKDHIPFMSALDIGVTKIIKDGTVQNFSTIGGVFQFKDDQALILTQEAEKGSDIDILRAEDAKKRAEARLNDNQNDIDSKRAEIALARALARLKAAMK